MKEPKFRTIHPSIKYFLDKNAEYYKWVSSISVFILTSTFGLFAFLIKSNIPIHGYLLFMMGWILILFSFVYGIFLVTHYSVMRPMFLIIPSDVLEKAKKESKWFSSFEDRYLVIKTNAEILYSLLFTAGFLILLGTSIWNILCL